MPPFPEPLRGNEPNTFAEQTVKERFPRIVQQVIDDNELPAAAVANLRRLIAEIPSANLRPLAGGEPETAVWNRLLEPHLAQNWLDAPWLIAEIYLYRRILEAVDYFETGADPFAKSKQGGLFGSRERIRPLTAQLVKEWEKDAALGRWFAIALWGNQADQSLFATHADEPSHADETARQAHTLIDDTAAALTHLRGREQPRVDILLDNAGYELVLDLCLAAFLLRSEAALLVTLHAKPHPFFVSDATPSDINFTIAEMAASPHAATSQVGQFLLTALAGRQLVVTTHDFWTRPTRFWEMPTPLWEELAAANLLISKGDLNYRRWLGDLHWDYTTPIAEIVRDPPTAVLLLRTLKAEVMAGLTAAQVAHLNGTETNWLTSGRYGVIQFLPPTAA